MQSDLRILYDLISTYMDFTSDYNPALEKCYANLMEKITNWMTALMTDHAAENHCSQPSGRSEMEAKVVSRSDLQSLHDLMGLLSHAPADEANQYFIRRFNELILKKVREVLLAGSSQGQAEMQSNVSNVISRSDLLFLHNLLVLLTHLPLLEANETFLQRFNEYIFQTICGFVFGTVQGKADIQPKVLSRSHLQSLHELLDLYSHAPVIEATQDFLQRFNKLIFQKLRQLVLPRTGTSQGVEQWALEICHSTGSNDNDIQSESEIGGIQPGGSMTAEANSCVLKLAVGEADHGIIESESVDIQQKLPDFGNNIKVEPVDESSFSVVNVNDAEGSQILITDHSNQSRVNSDLRVMPEAESDAATASNDSVIACDAVSLLDDSEISHCSSSEWNDQSGRSAMAASEWRSSCFPKPADFDMAGNAECDFASCDSIIQNLQIGCRPWKCLPGIPLPGNLAQTSTQNTVTKAGEGFMRPERNTTFKNISGLITCGLCPQVFVGCTTACLVRKRCSYHVFSLHTIRRQSSMPTAHCEECEVQSNSFKEAKCHVHESLIANMVSMLYESFCSVWSECFPQIGHPNPSSVQSRIILNMPKRRHANRMRKFSCTIKNGGNSAQSGQFGKRQRDDVLRLNRTCQEPEFMPDLPEACTLHRTLVAIQQQLPDFGNNIKDESVDSPFRVVNIHEADRSETLTTDHSNKFRIDRDLRLMPESESDAVAANNDSVLANNAVSLLDIAHCSSSSEWDNQSGTGAMAASEMPSSCYQMSVDSDMTSNTEPDSASPSCDSRIQNRRNRGRPRKYLPGISLPSNLTQRTAQNTVTKAGEGFMRSERSTTFKNISGLVSCGICHQVFAGCNTAGVIRNNCCYHVFSVHTIHGQSSMPTAPCGECEVQSNSFKDAKYHKHKSLIANMVSMLYESFCLDWSECFPQIGHPNLPCLQFRTINNMPNRRRICCGICHQVFAGCNSAGLMRNRCSYHVFSLHTIRGQSSMPAAPCGECEVQSSSFKEAKYHVHESLIANMVSMLYESFCSDWSKCFPQIGHPNLSFLQVRIIHCMAKRRYPHRMQKCSGTKKNAGNCAQLGQFGKRVSDDMMRLNRTCQEPEFTPNLPTTYTQQRTLVAIQQQLPDIGNNIKVESVDSSLNINDADGSEILTTDHSNNFRVNRDLRLMPALGSGSITANNDSVLVCADVSLLDASESSSSEWNDQSGRCDMAVSEGHSSCCQTLMDSGMTRNTERDSTSCDSRIQNRRNRARPRKYLPGISLPKLAQKARHAVTKAGEGFMRSRVRKTFKSGRISCGICHKVFSGCNTAVSLIRNGCSYHVFSLHTIRGQASMPTISCGECEVQSNSFKEAKCHEHESLIANMVSMLYESFCSDWAECFPLIEPPNLPCLQFRIIHCMTKRRYANRIRKCSGKIKYAGKGAQSGQFGKRQRDDMLRLNRTCLEREHKPDLPETYAQQEIDELEELEL